MHHIGRAITCLIVPLMVVTLSCSLAQAKETKTLLKSDTPTVSKKAPVLLSADEVEYDSPNNLAIATGRVEVSQGQTVILADRLIYDQAHNMVYAVGNVSMLQPSGDVFFADQVELKDDMKTGVIHQFRARLVDNSLFVASGAKKVSEQVVELFKAAYTPCSCEEDGYYRAPLWQLSADHAKIDEEAQKVYYKNTYFEVLDTPIFYSPYFSHATPGADNKSGLLMPTFLRSQNLGTVYKQPVYYTLSPDKDMTITPVYQSLAGPLVIGEYRQMFDDGLFKFEGSLTRADGRDAAGFREDGHETRGHYVASGDFRLDEHFRWGFDLRRASDATYLRLYNFSNDILLTSRGYVEGYDFMPNNSRSQLSVEGLSFQGLTGSDNRSVIPLVLPLANFNYQSRPGLSNSRVFFDANMMALTREDGNESRRISTKLGWKLPYITDGGQKIEFNTQLRSDIYNVNDVLLSNGERFDGFTGRMIPSASLNWRYPLIKQFDGDTSLLIEPIAEVNISPHGGNPEKIPNEDSLFPEFTDTNLFSRNRYPGLDRVENGLRSSYALRAVAKLSQRTYVDMLFGQHWRADDDISFPYSSNLQENLSDYVGKVGVTSDPFELAYRFRLDKDNFLSQRSEVNASLFLDPVSFSTSYLSIKRDPFLAPRENLAASGSLRLSKHWSWTASGSHDLLLNQLDVVYTGLVYKDECINLTAMVGKDYTQLKDIEASTSFWLRVSLKNLE